MQNVKKKDACYIFEKVPITKSSSTPIFDSPHVDVTYVIHLIGNGRLKRVRKQLIENRPSKVVYILKNKGFRKCKKKLPEQNVMYDIIHAILTAFKHALDHNFKTVMLLEDDFEFLPTIRDQDHIDNVKRFIEKNNTNEENFIYSLGSLPTILFPVSLFDWKNYVGVSLGAHCVIYNSVFMKSALRDKLKNIKDWDHYTYWRRYNYETTLCGQVFNNTESKLEWNTPWYFPRFGLDIAIFFGKILQLDKSIEPGYSILNIFSKFIGIVVMIIAVLIFVKSVRFLKNKFVN
jgi:hypothetical protein